MTTSAESPIKAAGANMSAAQAGIAASGLKVSPPVHAMPTQTTGERVPAAGTQYSPSQSSAGVKAARLVVLISGSGTNLQALIDACEDPGYGCEVVAVGSDRPGIKGLARAEEAGIPTFVERVSDYASREEWDTAITEAVEDFDPDLVVSAGFLKLLGPEFLNTFDGRVVNTHNSLLPSFAGVRGPADALAYGVKYTGATLFFVDPGMDTGRVIAQCVVPVEAGDTLAELLERIQVAERRQLVDTVGKMMREGWTTTGRWVEVG
ncbi:phosphoribosylglycinamide formyltransferase [Gleimia europaea]|uniref:Phosphoribosylglycinamide formyltransferase n=1 Tax=Gleimia europaea ACS-120-V-Col10b TaxID=883069 RepID=A0A9W5RD30_9ACTO|nr:phosphoribosylglycinamide formyltransferase [Gleimia europaea]EPD29498.1 phosphoribosylglycinamide formyltransferase [Gleimia europaea ACS-120-V-Col10b]